jgi:hypothetical protein
MKMPFKSEPGIVSVAVAVFMTFLGALANYAFKVLSGQVFSWRTLSLQIIVSLFAGSIMMMIAIHYSLTDEFIGGACGMAGWSGASLIKALEKRLINKAAGGQNADQQ